MTTRSKFHLVLAGAAMALAVAGAALAQGRTADSLRATGKVGEQADGFLACVSSCDAETSAAIRAINDRRAAEYRRLASNPELKVSEAAAAQAAGRRQIADLPSGQYYRPAGGGWTRK